MMKKIFNRTSLIRLAQLLFLSFIVGSILAVMNIQLIDIAVFVMQKFRLVRDMGFESIGAAFDLILLGLSVLGPVLGIWYLFNWCLRKVSGSGSKSH